MMCVGTHEGSGLPSHSRAGGGSRGHNLGTFAGLIGEKSGQACGKRGWLRSCVYIICCSIYFNKSSNLCGILYLEASDVGGVYPPPHFSGKEINRERI